MALKLQTVIHILRRCGLRSITLDREGFDTAANSMISWASHYDPIYRDPAIVYEKYVRTTSARF